MSNPNYLTPPDPNRLPQYGNIQPPHEWPATAQSINVALEEIRESTRQEHTTRRELGAQYSHLDPTLQLQILQASLKGRDFALEREVPLDFIRDTAMTEDTEQILNLLYGEVASTTAERQQVDGGVMRAHADHRNAENANDINAMNNAGLRRVRAAQGPLPEMSKTDSNRLAALQSERMHHKGDLDVRVPVVGGLLNTHLNYALNIPGWVKLNREEKALAALQQQYANQKRTRKLEDVSVQRPYSESANKELMARVGAERSSQDRANLGEFDSIVDNLFTEINDRRGEAVRNFNDANNTINTAFEACNLGERPLDPQSRIDVRDALDQMSRQGLQELSPRDPAYKHVFSRFVQQTVRHEERNILEHANNPYAPAPAGEYTPDGGILMYSGTPDEAVFYDDGSTARAEVASTNPADWTRRNAAGQEINPGPKEGWPHITEQLGREPLQDVFNRWETCRSPEAAARLHAELGFHTQRLETQEDGHLSHLERISDQMKDLDRTMIDQGRIAADASLSDEARDAARDVIRDAAAEKSRLTREETQTNRDLDTTHAELTPLLYQRMRLTVVDDGSNNTPTMMTHGAVFQNMELFTRDSLNSTGNPYQRDLWALLPDGRSAYPVVDPATGRVVIYKVYNPDGTFQKNSPDPY